MLAKSPAERFGAAGQVIEHVGNLAQAAELAAVLAQLDEQRLAADPLASPVTRNTNGAETIPPF